MVTSKKNTVSYHKSRLRELLWLMIVKHQPVCPLCKEEFIKNKDLPARGTDNFTEHHLDHNHYNTDTANRVLVHRSCHKGHHTRNNINFWSQF